MRNTVLHLTSIGKVSVALLCSILVLQASAQLTGFYAFTQQSGTFTSLGSGSTTLWTGNGYDNQVSGAITIPTFYYNNVGYTNLYVSANGYITFGSAPAATNYTPLSSNAGYAGAISAFGTDLVSRNQPGNSGTRDVRYQQIGDEFVIEWRQVRRKALTEWFSFQIRLNTATSVIRFVYGAIGQGPDVATTLQPEVGLRGANNNYATNVLNRRVTAGPENWASSLPGADNASTMRFTSTAPAKSFANGLTYIFTPDCYAPTGTACNDGDPCTINDAVDANCDCVGTFQDTDNDGICNANDNCPNVSGQIGSPCDDGEACTINDVLDANCNCAGTFQDTDNDGVCNANDNCPNVTGQIGSVCNDNDPCTINDVIDANCNCAGTFEDTDNDGICNVNDDCPNVTGQIGSSCDDGDASTGNDVLQADCTCAGELIDCLGIPGGSTLPGTACNDNDPLTLNDAYDNNCNCTGAAAAHSVTIAFQTDANGQQITWEILGENTNTVMCNGGGWYPPFADGISETCGLPDGDFKLRVYDSGGDGIANGGYILRMSGVDGARIIDNRYNFNNGSVSAIANDLGFTLPIGTDRLINSNCDKLDWLSNQFLVASPNAAVSAEWIPNAANSLQDADSGYEFWIFDPNGSYSFRRFRSHNQADGFGNVGATRACHMQINNWTAANHIPTGVLMNVRVRGRVNGVNMEWGPACRFKIDPVAAACPMTKLMDLPGNQFLSCGQFRTWASNSLVHARPVGGATAYQFRFRLPAENFEVVRTTASYFVSLGWSNAAPLITGSTYEVDVRAFKNGQWCPWGDICSLTIGSPVQGGSQNSLHISNSTPAPEMMLWPNPNTDGQVRITLHGIEADVVMVEMMDLTGKKVMHRSFNMGGEMVIELPGTVTPGVYLVRAEAAGTVLTQRLIVQ